MAPIIPVPKMVNSLMGFCETDKGNKISCSDFVDNDLLIRHLKAILPTAKKKNEKHGILTIELIKNHLENEAYRLTITEENIKIESGSEAGAFYAIKTLEQLIRNNGTNIPCVAIEDAPDIKVRGLMLDISRAKVPTIKTLKEIVDTISRLKYNHLELYVEGFSFEYKSFPNVLKKGNYITLDEYLELEKYCNERFIDFVPNQNGFGHMTDWLCLEEYQELREVEGLFTIWGSKRPSSVIDATNPKSIELVTKMYEDMLPYVKSQYFNMNFDEAFELGYGKTKEVCALKGKATVFKEYYEQLAKVVRKYHKKPIIWADVVINHPEVVKQFSPDTIFVDWGYNLDYPFYRHLKTLKECGVSFMAAPGTCTWGMITGRYPDMLGTIENACSNVIKYDGLGMLLTDWGDLGHLQYWTSSLPGVIYGALSSWNNNQNYEYLISEYLGKNIFSNHDLAQIIIDLGNYNRLEGEYRSYGSKTFAPILFAENAINEENKLDFFLSKIKVNLLTPNQAEALKDEFASIGHRIAKIKPTSQTENIAILEVSNSIHLLEALVDVNIMFRKYFEGFYNEFAVNQCIRDLDSYLLAHSELWNYRNKSAGYVESARRIEQVKDILKMFKERGQ